MTIIDEHHIRAPIDVCFDVASDVERWPAILPHYRRVRFHEKQGHGLGVVEMSAWRRFAPGVSYPTWWVSDMRAAQDEHAVYYKHIAGVTRGMNVKWELQQRGNETFVRLFHTWDGPGWPLISRMAARLVILPHFVSAIAQRTLAGVAREAESRVSLKP